MKPIDIRNESFKSLSTRMEGYRAIVLWAWQRLGPGTTRGAALRSGIDILTFRPRTTELYQMGLLVCIDSIDNQGVYRVRTASEWETWAREQRGESVSSQLQMPMP